MDYLIDTNDRPIYSLKDAIDDRLYKVLLSHGLTYLGQLAYLQEDDLAEGKK